MAYGHVFLRSAYSWFLLSAERLFAVHTSAVCQTVRMFLSADTVNILFTYVQIYMT